MKKSYASPMIKSYGNVVELTGCWKMTKVIGGTDLCNYFPQLMEYFGVDCPESGS